MKNLGKYLILCLSVGLMLAHNFIPHHHHYREEMEHQVCVEKSQHEDEAPEIGEMLFCNHHETENETECDECHFNIETTNHSKKFIQLYSSGYKKCLNNPVLNVQERVVYYSEHYIPISIYLPILRGPPERS